MPLLADVFSSDDWLAPSSHAISWIESHLQLVLRCLLCFRVAAESGCFSQAMANGDDKVKVVHVVARDQESLADKYRSKQVKLAAEAVIAEDPRAEYVEVEEDTDSTIADTIVDMAIEEEATYVAMGADGVRAFAAGKSAGLGSVSDRLIKISRVSVVVTQDNDSLI
jgi:nucleotide-binding universal stress UspA family protein